jgi:hypothetical protein
MEKIYSGKLFETRKETARSFSAQAGKRRFSKN